MSTTHTTDETARKFAAWQAQSQRVEMYDELLAVARYYRDDQEAERLERNRSEADQEAAEQFEWFVENVDYDHFEHLRSQRTCPVCFDFLHGAWPFGYCSEPCEKIAAAAHKFSDKREAGKHATPREFAMEAGRREFYGDGDR